MSRWWSSSRHEKFDPRPIVNNEQATWSMPYSDAHNTFPSQRRTPMHTNTSSNQRRTPIHTVYFPVPYVLRYIPKTRFPNYDSEKRTRANEQRSERTTQLWNIGAPLKGVLVDFLSCRPPKSSVAAGTPIGQALFEEGGGEGCVGRRTASCLWAERSQTNGHTTRNTVIRPMEYVSVSEMIPLLGVHPFTAPNPSLH